MGLDILLGANNQAELDAGHYDPDDHQLSRNFCNFMCRRWAIEEEPELDQIGRLTGVDISPLYEMDNYTLPEDLSSMLEYADDDAERQEILARTQAASAAMAGNIDRVTATVEGLLTQLTTMEDLPSRLRPDPEDTLYATAYFANFSAARMNAYDNTFGQDLRNFRSFLEYAKGKGSETVFFVYG
ncbi:hypothetical protein [Hymenobacter actinosclerus]|uniref:Uncharacterized protein n=1 Tax=Hymenobacter actinosclerus TaxID=82805 RepID=A0A1I0ACU2_9BACT|nr:hypothetical protein [Hymenobacter actinosclerus]SES92031.1 hypothetical protein SAMN04487998_0674 [Hymenobacter actinosclerus]